jgi:hypothetical protein
VQKAADAQFPPLNSSTLDFVETEKEYLVFVMVFGARRVWKGVDLSRNLKQERAPASLLAL